MNILLDTSVILAACGSANGASRTVFTLHRSAEWRLLVGTYGLTEVNANLGKLPADAKREWAVLSPQLQTVRDIVTFRHPLTPLKSKDIPVLATALAWADVLLTLDEADFGPWIGKSFNKLQIFKPADFLMQQRRLGYIK